MECPNIGEIKFSQVSLDAIEEIRSKRAFGQALVAVIGLGTFANIFAGNGPVEATYSLYSTDFETMALSMATVPMITKKSIENGSGYDMAKGKQSQRATILGSGIQRLQDTLRKSS